LLDHLHRTAQTPAAKAYYLRLFVDDLAYQIYGSAVEVDLDRGIYDGVREGKVRSAAELNELSRAAFARYYPAAMIAPEMKVDWARNRLYFIDPLYDVNYLFAGLLAAEYLRQFETDPRDFSGRYVALLKNGFDDTPQALAKRFLEIDLDDTDLLVERACALIDARAAALEKLYASIPARAERARP
jgi:oligoendopeptidase F